MKSGMILGVGVLLMLTTPLLYPQPMGRMDHRPQFDHLRGIIRELNLTDAQKKDLENSQMDLAKQLVAHRAKLSTAGLELRQLLRADNPDKGAIEKKMNEISQLQSQGRVLFVNGWFTVNKMLTPEQQKVWKKALSQRQGMGGRGPTMRGPRAGWRQGHGPEGRDFRGRMMMKERMMQRDRMQE